MSSATSTDFRPWHFFILAALVASTAAVLLSRQSTPEHLILISLTIASAGAAAAGFYRVLAPFALDDVAMLDERPTERARAALEREKSLVLRSIKELEFDKAMGKIAPKDFDEMAGRLRARAVMLMKQLDEGASAYREIIEREVRNRIQARSEDRAVRTAENTKCACGTFNDADAAFCKRCGTKLEAVHS
jgi:hypothetical protein